MPASLGRVWTPCVVITGFLASGLLEGIACAEAPIVARYVTSSPWRVPVGHLDAADEIDVRVDSTGRIAVDREMIVPSPADLLPSRQWPVRAVGATFEVIEAVRPLALDLTAPALRASIDASPLAIGTLNTRTLGPMIGSGSPARHPLNIFTSPYSYAGFVGLQLLDAHSTLRATRQGHREANPFMSGIASNPGALLGIKAATAAGVVLAARTLARRRPVAAALMMLAANSATAMIVAHNYSVTMGR